MCVLCFKSSFPSSFSAVRPLGHGASNRVLGQISNFFYYASFFLSLFFSRLCLINTPYSLVRWRVTRVAGHAYSWPHLMPDFGLHLSALHLFLKFSLCSLTGLLYAKFVNLCFLIVNYKIVCLWFVVFGCLFIKIFHFIDFYFCCCVDLSVC